MKQHNHIKSNRPTRRKSRWVLHHSSLIEDAILVHLWQRCTPEKLLRKLCFLFRDEVPESTALYQKKLPFQEVRKKDLSVSVYVFFHLCFHLDESMSLNGNVPLIVMYIFYFKPQTNHQLTHQLGLFFVAVNSSLPPKEENQTCALKINKCSIKPGFCWGVYLLLIN